MAARLATRGAAAPSPAARVAETRVRIKGTRVYVAQEPAFDGVGTMARRMRNWVASGGSVNAVISGALDDLRNRSRDNGRKVPWVDNAVETLASNIVGTGIVPNPRAPDPGWRAALQEAWNEWVDEADFADTTDWYGQQRLVARSVVEAGEVLARIHDDLDDDGLHVPLQVQIFEADHLPVAETRPVGFAPGGGYVMNGVQFDARGRRTGYWLWPNHPGEIALQTGRHELEFHPKRDTLHIFRPNRPGQIRGYPWIASALIRVRDLLEYEDAELVRKKFAAMFTAFIVTSAEAPEEVLTANTRLGEDGRLLPTEAVLEPGTSQFLQPGEDVKFSEPADLGASYEPFLKANLRAAAAAFGLTYEQLTGDLEGVNFSSIRAGLNEFQRRCEAWQHQIVAHQFCRPIWHRFVRAAILCGAVPTPAGYAANWRPWHRVEWMPVGWRYVNPLQESAAEQMDMRSGLSSRTKQVARRGYSVEELDREIAEDNRRADQHGLVFDSDPRRTAGSGAIQPDPAQSPDSPPTPRRQSPDGGARVVSLRPR